MTKKEIREICLARRKALTDDEVSLMSSRIAEQFVKGVNLSHVKIVHLFLPLEKFREPDTRLIVDELKRGAPQISISIPKVSADGTLTNYFLEGATLATNKWGLSEPVGGNMTPTHDIDLVLVPLLAFDKQGNRVGYGKGFYDRFLKQCRPDCQRIGLAFFPAVDSVDDLQPYDEPLDSVITPEKVFTFAGRQVS